MDNPKFEICSDGYNVEQADFYIKKLTDKLNFLDSAYNQSLESIKKLECENKALKEKLNAISLIIDNSESNKTLSSEESAHDEHIVETESGVAQKPSAETQAENNYDISVDNEFDILKEEIDSLKNFLKHS